MQEIDRVEQRRKRSSTRPPEDDSIPGALVDHFVVPSVIEENARPFLPGVKPIPDPHARRIVLRHDESEVISDDTEMGSVVGRHPILPASRIEKKA